MRTRRGERYPTCPAAVAEAPETRRRKKRRSTAEGGGGSAARWCCGGSGGGLFEELPDDLVVSVLADVAASAGSPADLAGAILTCKRFRELGHSTVVLAAASFRCLAVRAERWSDSAHRFMERCADAGNLDACYLLGMIRFYCLGSRGSGAALMAAAAVGGHREALYSLAVIQFNGSGGGKDDRDLRAGAALCARAAALGHVAAIRELGHCLQDGYGVRRSLLDGHRLLIQANARELAAAASSPSSSLRGGGDKKVSRRRHSCSAAAEEEAHAANRFLVGWFASRPPESSPAPAPGEEADAPAAGGGGLRLCSQALCGRAESRRHEFRRCSACGAVNYCSRVCQALHWKTAHKAECAPMDR